MTDLLGYEFFQNAIFISVLASILCGIIGVYVVVKRLSFISGSISHAAFGGIGIAYLLGISPAAGALAFGSFCALLLGWVRNRFRQQEDALIGALWAIGMSVGILCLSLGSGYVGDVFGYLFGSILFGSTQDLITMAVLDVAVIGSVAVLYFPLKAVTFDEEYAKVLNIPTSFIYQFLLQIICIAIVVLLKLVGGILVIALLTLPAMSARNMTLKLLPMMGISIGLALVSMLGGLGMASVYSLPPGPLIVFIAASVYILSLVYRK
jgi:zinc transport system permease protein